MRFKPLLLGVMALAMTSSQAMAFELTGSLDAHLDPVLEISRDDTGITVDYTFNGACQSEDDLYPGTFNFSIPGFGVNREPGEGAWLMRWDSFEIPDGCDATVNIILKETTDFFLNLAPARKDLINSSNDVYSLDNVPPIGDYSGWMPSVSVEKGLTRLLSVIPQLVSLILIHRIALPEYMCWIWRLMKI